MKRFILAIGLLAITAGCASTITFKGDCDVAEDKRLAPCIVTAEDYTIVETVDKNGKVSRKYYPTKWYKGSVQALSEAACGLSRLLPLIGQ